MPEPTQTKDTLTLSLRLHDPKEKKDAAKSTRWAVVDVPRTDLVLPFEEFMAQYVIPAFKKLEHETLNQATVQ